ncbi:hypothetical protein QFC24_000683 [Naganishia onofrii]|uniref:Uncharacterized protein n=1 Tax=Naganishia onofrii TaxID=1851511 RepID=A0ACC2XXE3_9TREE|nr:hypothetical protein QFC24_000683 [Naganishia onofrii]
MVAQTQTLPRERKRFKMPLLSSLAHSVGVGASNPPPDPTPSSDALSTIPAPPSLAQPLRLLIAFATLSSTTNNPLYPFLPPGYRASWRLMAGQWSAAVHRLLQLEPGRLPTTQVPPAEQVSSAALAYWDDMKPEEREEEQSKVVLVLLLASVFQPPTEGEQVEMVDIVAQKDTVAAAAAAKETDHHEHAKIQPPKTDKVPTLSYTPPARQLIYTTLKLLHIPATPTLPHTESTLATSLFTALQKSTTATNSNANPQTSVEQTRSQHADGWGGSTGRWLATATGAVIGGVAIGLTGGLAAPAIAALVPSFMTFGLLTTASAPLVLGSVFGIAGGGLTSRRVRERWRGVEEFEFVDVKVGSEKVVDVEEDDHGSSSRSRSASVAASASASVESSPLLKDGEFGKPGVHEKRVEDAGKPSFEGKDSVDNVKAKVPVTKGTAPSLIVRRLTPYPSRPYTHSLTLSPATSKKRQPSSSPAFSQNPAPKHSSHGNPTSSLPPAHSRTAETFTF